MKLCLSIAPSSMAEALRKMKQARGSADLIELRVDGIQDLDLPRLLRKPRPGVIVTNRRAGEGGKFTGPGEEQIDILSQAAALGADYVDIEWSWGKDTLKQLATRSRRASVILSYHNFQETPRELAAIYRKMRSTGADLLKIATMANSIEDNKRLFDLCKRANGNRQSIIGVCMGAYGEISRILGGKYGSFLTFGSASGAEPTAPGQRTADDLKNVFRINTLNSRTKVFGLVGNPVAQSKGVVYHNGDISVQDGDGNGFDYLAGIDAIVGGEDLAAPESVEHAEAEGDCPPMPGGHLEELLDFGRAPGDGAAGDWATLWLHNSKNDSLVHCIIANGGYEYRLGNVPMLDIAGGSPTFNCTKFEAATSVLVQNDNGGVPTFTACCFIGNSSIYGLLNMEHTLKLPVTGNFWGDASGPYVETDTVISPGDQNPQGLGCRASSFVIFRPWVTECAAARSARGMSRSPRPPSRPPARTLKAAKTKPFARGTESPQRAEPLPPRSRLRRCCRP